jgi:hypothetical protein
VARRQFAAVCPVLELPELAGDLSALGGIDEHEQMARAAQALANLAMTIDRDDRLSRDGDLNFAALTSATALGLTVHFISPLFK